VSGPADFPVPFQERQFHSNPGPGIEPRVNTTDKRVNGVMKKHLQIHDPFMVAAEGIFQFASLEMRVSFVFPYESSGIRARTREFHHRLSRTRDAFVNFLLGR